MAFSTTGTLSVLELQARSAALARWELLLIASLMLVGLLVKMAIFPFHSWLPDAYVEAPMPLTAIFSTMTGIGGYAALRILYTCFPQILGERGLTITLSILALVTIVYAGYLALAQTRLKRLLAYSSISQMGYLLFGLSSASILGLAGAILIYVAHSIAKALLFMVSGVFSKCIGTDDLGELGGIAGKLKVASTAFVIGFLSLMGFPPLLGFWGELYVFAGSIYGSISSSIDVPRLIITMLVIIFAILTAGYGLWTIRRSLFGERSEMVEGAEPEPPILLAPIAASMLLLIILGIQPSLITMLLGALS